MAGHDPRRTGDRFARMGAGGRFLVLLATIIVLIAAAEGVVRLGYAVLGRSISTAAASAPRQYLPYVGFMRAPLATYPNGHGTDRLGFLLNGNDAGRDLTRKDPREFRVFVLGGSTVAGIDAPSPALTIPGRLETALAILFRENEIPLEPRVVNAGVDGYYSNQEFLLLKYYLSALSADYVVVFDGTNDYIVWGDRPEPVFQLLRNNFHDYQAEFFDAYNRAFTVSGSIALFVRSLTSYSALADFAYKLASRPGRIGEILSSQTGEGESAIVARYLSRHIERYRINIESTLSYARDNGLGLAYVLQPTLLPGLPLSAAERAIVAGESTRWHHIEYFAPKKLFYSQAADMFAELHRRYAAASEFTIADMSGLFNNKSVETTIYRDSVHYTEAGNAKIVERLLPEIASPILDIARRRAAHDRR